ncbi:MAG: transcriptional repressor [Dehalococcoidales bacterium]|nr:MAG: transcriptional repressor [Dehalococcoidales bacterium]
MRLTAKEISAALKEHGYKLTPQRRAIIKAITSNNDCLNPQGIYTRVRSQRAGIGLVTVYRTLEILTRLELICELPAGGIQRNYTLSASEHHHHLTCSGCGTVIDFTGHNLIDLENKLSRESGFIIESHMLEFFGLCQGCQKVS